MKKKDTQYFQDLITARLKELYRQIDQQNGVVIEIPRSADVNDNATAEAECAFKYTMKMRERNQVRELQKAMDRIVSGEYGECSECGEDIALERLKAMPCTVLCIECQAREENLVK